MTKIGFYVKKRSIKSRNEADIIFIR